MKYRIKEILKEKGLNGVELAEMLGINKITLYRNLSENNDLRISTLEKIATALNVPLWSLLVSKDEITKDETSEQKTAPNVGAASVSCPHCGKSFAVSVSVKRDATETAETAHRQTETK